MFMIWILNTRPKMLSLYQTGAAETGKTEDAGIAIRGEHKFLLQPRGMSKALLTVLKATRLSWASDAIQKRYRIRWGSFFPIRRNAQEQYQKLSCSVEKFLISKSLHQFQLPRCVRFCEIEGGTRGCCWCRSSLSLKFPNGFDVLKFESILF